MEIEEKQAGKIKSANIHVIGICNYHCQHCFDRCLTQQYMTPKEWKPILEYLKERGVEKINIAGGEPFLYPYLNEMCRLLKSIGFKVSIVSNGSRITQQQLREIQPHLDWLGLSVDSPDEEDEIIIGRHTAGSNHLDNIKTVACEAHRLGIKVKLNITAVRRSIGKNFGELIESIRPERVKVFRALTLKGANDDIPDTWSVTDDEFQSFRERHLTIPGIVFEDNEDMIGSYLMFDPIGRWMVNGGGTKRFLSFQTLVRDGLMSEVEASKYYGRNAVYDW